MIGFGYDVHKLASGESLVLGGVRFDEDFGTVAHSDGDALLHAICDALLGAAGLGDIGEHFPDSDPDFKNIDSSILLKRSVELLQSEGFFIINIDATIVCEKPKITPRKTEMREKIAAVCSLSPTRVNVKATTNEKLGFLGASEGIAAYCVCQIESAGE